MTTLAALNTLRERAGQKPLKSWKESKAKLAAAIDKLNAALAPSVPVTVLPVTAPELIREHKRNAEIEKIVEQRLRGDDVRPPKPVVKKAPTSAPPAPVTRKRHAPDGCVTLADIARDLNISPKAARAIMRKVSIPADYVVGKYVFKSNRRQWVEQALRA